MKVMTVLGTRPEIIRLSCVIEKLDALCEHVLVHTGQNYAPALSDVFFEQLGVRAPDSYLGIREASFGAQIGGIIASVEGSLVEERPDRVLVLGDTNSGLAAVVAKRLGIPVFHMEAGNRCFDDRVPEEVNRRIIDHSSDVLMPYTERSRANLLREGFPGERVYVTFADKENYLVAAYDFATMTLGGTAAPESLTAATVSANLLDVMGVRPAIGRGFREGEDGPAAGAIAILGNGIWKRRFGGEPGIVGRSILLDEKPTVVVGVLPPGVEFPSGADVWVPIRYPADPEPGRGALFLPVVARLKPGVSLAAAQTQMRAIAAKLERDHPRTNAS